MASPPAFTRSISSHPWVASRLPPLFGTDDEDSRSSKLFSASAIASSSSSSSNTLLHPHVNHTSSLSAGSSSARSRTRSIGADGQSLTQQRKGLPLNYDNEPSRGPGTPDISLDAFQEIKGRRDSPVSIKSRLTQDHDINVKEGTRKRSSSDVMRTSTPPRPRLTTQLKSFISHLKASSAIRTPNEEKEEDSASSDVAKARLSHEADNPGEEEGWQSRRKRSIAHQPSKLVMPAARAAGPDGLGGLNTDSPPLTPISDGANYPEATEAVRELTHSSSLRHPWSAAQARADYDGSHTFTSTVADRDCVTPCSTSTITSGRSSPLFSGLSVGSSAGTYASSSRPHSSSAMFKIPTSPYVGLLPSHTISPSSSPPPPEHAARAYLHASSASSIFTNLLSRLSLALSTTRLPPLRRHLPALLFLLTAFIGSTLCILLALSTLPLHLPSHITDLTVAEIRDMSLHLKAYSRSGTKAYLHTLSVLAAFYTWKQAYTVPGSLIMNVVFGAMYGTWMGTLYTSLLTSLGGVFCYLLMAPLGSLIRTLPGLQAVLEKMQRALESHSAHASRRTPPTTSREQDNGRQTTKASNNNLWSYLLVLRVLPIVPYGLMNIACSVLRVPLLPYAATLAVGSIPWNACTVQVGELLVQVVSALDGLSTTSADGGGFHTAAVETGTSLGKAVKAKAQSGALAIAAKVWNKEMIFKLIFMSLISLAPLLLQRYLKKTGIDDQHDELTEPGNEHRIIADLDQEASVTICNDEDVSALPLLSAWRSSLSSSSQAVTAAATAAIGRITMSPSSHAVLEHTPVKRFSGVWTNNPGDYTKVANRRNIIIEGAEYSQHQRSPSQLRAVTATRVV